MSTVNIPEYEVKWLLELRESHSISINVGNVYPVSILPPKLKKFVKEQNRETEYINMGPSVGCSDGMIWSIWGWKSLPKSSSAEETTWHASFKAQKEPPTLAELQLKITTIQADLSVLSSLLTQYRSQ